MQKAESLWVSEILNLHVSLFPLERPKVCTAKNLSELWHLTLQLVIRGFILIFLFGYLLAGNFTYSHYHFST